MRTIKTDPLNRAREAFADLLAKDVLDSQCYDLGAFGGNPRNWAMDHTNGMTLAEVRHLTNELRAERRRVFRLTGGY